MRVLQSRALSLADEVQSVLKWLKSHSTKATRDGMARVAIPSDKAYGVADGSLVQGLRQLGLLRRDEL